MKNAALTLSSEAQEVWEDFAQIGGLGQFLYRVCLPRKIVLKGRFLWLSKGLWLQI